MSRERFWNPDTCPDKSDKRTLSQQERVDRTCPVQEPDVSGNPYLNPVTGPDMSKERLSRDEIRLDWICPVLGPDISNKRLWNPAQRLDKPS
jgi:hypothetical protein